MNALVREAAPLRWHRGWAVLGVLLMVAVAAIALLPATRHLTAMALALPEGDKLLHMVAFAALMGWWGNLYHRPRPRLGVAAACLLFGLLIELAQWPHNPKDASVWDLAADALGLALGALLLRTPLAGVLARVERGLGMQQAQR
ncbi:VanZ family protein [Frateuria edaphi]|uniref:VanZ family protein n=1 Tax=Frateuria edaphi TaxID=2898793 RepID=UPI001E4FFE2B|nr:VanZ family protein [Frateuria edaphi]UGB45297.1 VanZ family protein [Frateuria edaphi]